MINSTGDSVVVLDPVSDGRLPIIDAEFEMVEQIVNADQRRLDVLERRGIDPASVRAMPLSAGSDDYPEERGLRILRTLGFQQQHEKDHPGRIQSTGSAPPSTSPAGPCCG
jgi:primary-amine oxidase